MFWFKSNKNRLQTKLFFSKLIVLVFSMLSISLGASTQEYNVKAVFLFHFIDFASWPEDKHQKDVRNICVYGNNPFDSRLDMLANAGLQKNQVKIVKKIDLVDSDKCHILFVGSSKKKQLNEIFDYLAYKPILTVSDIDNFASNKGMIGFAVKSGKVKLEVNLDSVKASGIKLSSNLIEIAKVVRNSFKPGKER